MQKHIVEIVRHEGGEVVRRMSYDSERQADRAEDGVNINLNHDEYYTRVVVEG